MRRHVPKIAFGWFLFGLGSQFQLWGVSLSFTELFVFAAAPILFIGELPYMRRNGMMRFFWLSVAVMIGGGIACLVNHTPFHFALRGMAVVCLLPCTIVVSHWMLRRNMNGFKWWLVGAVFSSVLCTFIFQRSVEVSQLAGGVADKHAAEAIMAGPIYWIGRLGEFLNVPAKGWYLQCPTMYCVGAPLFMAAFSMLTSVSGRSAALGALASAALVLLGGKKQRTMRRVGRWFWGLLIAAIIGAFVAKNVYAYAATHNLLGEGAREKYENQTKGNKGMMALLLGGRMESFCGLIACVDKPIIGFGPWALDRGGYAAEFLGKYGDSGDYARYMEAEQFRAAEGLDKLIPCHAYITEFWCWYGIFGLLFWLYVLFVFARYFRQDCWAVPQWYMWIAASIPGFCWGIFFSPWSDRVGGILFVVACLMARAVRKGRQQLPMEMIREIKP